MPRAFVTAFFAEHLLDNPAGACFVLEALERRVLPPDPGGPVPEVLARLARAAFAEVLAGSPLQPWSCSRSSPDPEGHP